MTLYKKENINLYNTDSIDIYDEWPTPTVIICDGPYGISGFPGDPATHSELPQWYEPHIKKWSEKAAPYTTLWFWNTEIGWATVHPTLEKYGWEYVSCNVWDKGLSHVAGNVNTKTIRRLPVVTEVCVQYVKKAEFNVNHEKLSMKEWLRYEWLRSGLPLSKTNEACGVKNAATRKYFTKCHLWYMPPVDAFEGIVEYANKYGKEEGKPYFSINGKDTITNAEWKKMRAKFYCPIGWTNVWHVPQLRNSERVKCKNKALHLNQKPLEIIRNLITMASDIGDVVWDPFAGLFTTAIAASDVSRKCYCAESNAIVFEAGKKRVLDFLDNGL